MVGTAARTLVSSVIFWLSSKGTFKSALTKTFFPFKSASVKSPTLFFAMETTPLTPLPAPKDRTLEATFSAKSGSTAANPRPRREVERRRNELEEDGETWRSEERVREEEVAEEVEAWRRERLVGVVAEAIAAHHEVAVSVCEGDEFVGLKGGVGLRGNEEMGDFDWVYRLRQRRGQEDQWTMVG